MNGNDIAKLLEVDSWYKLITREEIAYVLRKQQAEIEALKENKFEPVKELTDEEIVGIRMTTEGNIKAFARAILKKASEK